MKSLKNQMNYLDFLPFMNTKLGEQLLLMTLAFNIAFEAFYLSKLDPIFDSSVHKFGRRCKDEVASFLIGGQDYCSNTDKIIFDHS